MSLLNSALKKFDLKFTNESHVYYKSDLDTKVNKYKNIKKNSPGTQTNILMEYIVKKKTSRPLLIDQPEDNIDNQTIYNTLKNWFREMKYNRQVIVVTHDANIAINSDSENLIIAEQIKQSEGQNKAIFNYNHGALEYENNIEIASNILDGGIEAVRKRLRKYGKMEEITNDNIE